MYQTTFIDRFLRAVQLDPWFYREVAEGVYPSKEGYLIVAIVTLCAVIEATISGLLVGSSSMIVESAILYIILLPAIYVILSNTSYLVAKLLLRGEGTAAAMRRAIAYAMAPLALGTLEFIPVVGGILSAVGLLACVIATIMAVRAAMRFERGKAIVSCGAGWIVTLVVLAIPFS